MSLCIPGTTAIQMLSIVDHAKKCDSVLRQDYDKVIQHEVYSIKHSNLVDIQDCYLTKEMKLAANLISQMR